MLKRISALSVILFLICICHVYAANDLTSSKALSWKVSTDLDDSYIHPPIGISGRCYGINRLFQNSVQVRFYTESMLCSERGTQIPDIYRLKEEKVLAVDDCIFLNESYRFKPERISQQSAEFYAKTINAIADNLPGVKVYNMLVPDSGEFYAPEAYYCRQTEMFDEVYDRLSPSVTPVRIANALYLHADEKIYFNTDHHWTQRGAYYAWRSFMALKNNSVPPLNKFQKVVTDDFAGSFVPKSEKNSKERFERFLPIYDVNVRVYEDDKMIGKGIKIKLINTDVNNYSGYIAGDNPLTLISGGVKNGKKLAVLKESVGNVLVTWAVNNYETIYVIDIRGFKETGFDMKQFYNKTRFDDLLIESYPTTIESEDLRNALKTFS